jgi:alkyl hydroperoxide reductase subunit AhpF
MPQLIIALVVVAASVGAGLVLRRRQAVAAPTQPSMSVPAQLDRADFPGAEAPWAVVVFSSATCHTCADVVRKANVLASRNVSVVEVEYGANTALHKKYDIQAVPLLAVVDSDGVVRRGFAGPVSATDLWAAVAEARDPDNANLSSRECRET